MATCTTTAYDYGTTIFLTTHFLEEADNLCNRVVIMKQGKEIITGSPQI